MLSREFYHAVDDCVRERVRQENLKTAGRFDYTPNEVSPEAGYLMLVEEVGEVARELQGGWDSAKTLDALEKELIQVAAIALAIVEGLNGE